MYIAQDLFCFDVLLTILFADVLSGASGIGGCRWPISVRAVLIEVSFWQFLNNPSSSASVADSVTFLMMMYSLELAFWSLVLGKNFLRTCFVPPVLICRIHWITCGVSFRFICILLLRLDVLRYNLEIKFSLNGINCRICLHRRQVL